MSTISERKNADGQGPPGAISPIWHRAARIGLIVGAAIASIGPAAADPQVVLPQGLPVQVVPTFTEPGLPAYNFTGGTYSVGLRFGGSSSSSSSSSVTGGSGQNLSGTAYDAMMSMAWGSQAADAALTMGVNPVALAATCYAESNCQNVGAGSSVSTAAGAFQMIDSTYTADINGALAYKPEIADQVVSGPTGQMDPATEAYAAAYELRSDALILQSKGFTDPTVLDVRTLYQFGSGVGPAVANADDSDNLNSYLQLTTAQLQANGLSSKTTVGEWRATVTKKLGSVTASQSVLSN